jgi:hypothetical protein
MAPAPACRINRWHIQKASEAAVFLAKKARNASKAAGRRPILVVGGEGALTEAVSRDLEAHGVGVVRGDLPDPAAALPAEEAGLGGVVCTYTDIRRSQAVARAVLAAPSLRYLPFECVVLPEEDYRRLRRHDRRTAVDFVSPLPTYPVDVFAIYEEALGHFQPKCELRDFMDLCQLLEAVERNGVPGAVAEFGAFQGHSGYLMADFLARRGSSRRLLLFDTFDRFPEEPLGIDRFWSGSHAVDFEALQGRFARFPFVELVRGDFTRTFDRAGVDRLALAYVDCDSFRATDYLLERLFPEVLAPGGILAVEDYGHPQLLGSRAAVHRFFDGRPGCVPFFSQFSGLYIVIKL